MGRGRKTDSLDGINILERDAELKDVAEHYSGKVPIHFKSSEELIENLDSE